MGSSQVEYGRHSIEALLKQNPICICPLVVCTIKRAVVRSNLQEDKETRVAIEIKKIKCLYCNLCFQVLLI